MKTIEEKDDDSSRLQKMVDQQERNHAEKRVVVKGWSPTTDPKTRSDILTKFMNSVDEKFSKLMDLELVKFDNVYKRDGAISTMTNLSFIEFPTHAWGMCTTKASGSA